MRSLFQLVDKILNRAQQRFVRGRRGSVLVLVVALVVILAIMGTAFMATARIDRYQSALQVTVTLVEPLLDEVWTMIQQAMLDDLNDTVPATPIYRPPEYAASNFEHWDSPTPDATQPTRGDPFLGDRVPVLIAGVPTWRYGSQLPSVAATDYIDLGTNTAIAAMATFSRGTHALQPGFLPIPGHATTDPAATNAWTSTKTFPTLSIVDLAGTIVPGTIPYLAADADGDGIADSLLFKLPIPVTGGITYYAAVRIIDNNSALNANQHWSQTNDFDASGNPVGSLGLAIGAGTHNLGVFPGHVGLAEAMFSTSAAAEMLALRQQRFGSASVSIDPVADNNATRTDFDYVTLCDALYMQLGRRLDNPGYNVPGSKFRRLPVADTGFTASRGGSMLDPDANGTNNLAPGAAPSIVERALYNSVYKGAINWVFEKNNRFKQYPANENGYWYDYLYNYDGVVQLAAPPAPALALGTGVAFYRTMRPLVVTSNPTSNAIQPHYVTAIGTLPAVTPAMASYGPLPIRTSINTAPFDELWRAFWNVMIQNDASGLGTVVPAERCFTNIASRTGGAWNSNTQLLIRAAVAAVNAEDMRDADEDITSHTVTITDSGVGNLDVEVFGSEKQPFISGATVDATGNVVQVTLHNPYGGSLGSIQGCVLAKRATGGAISPTSLYGPFAFPATTVINIAAGAGVVVGDELILMRQRSASGAPVAAVPDMVPLDHVVVNALPYVEARPTPWGVTRAGNGGWGAAIQIQNTGIPGPGLGSPLTFPFGGFARLGDIMQVPFIGGYTVKSGATLREVNSLPMDCVYVDDGDGTNDTYEAVGRFVPDPTAVTDHYAWALDLFDYFTTIQNPDFDFHPNIDPIKYTSAVGVGNQNAAQVNTGPDKLTPVEGLININTAPWRVLAAVPWVPFDLASGDANTNGVPDNIETLAKAIVTYRETNGPFKNLFELYKVTEMQTLQTALSGAGDLDDDNGDFTPAGQGNVDAVTGDFEERTMLLTRVSNLLTTRSDTFTCYVLVQAWRYADPALPPDINTNPPELVVQRRAAFIADRSQVTATAKTLKVTNVPMN